MVKHAGRFFLAALFLALFAFVAAAGTRKATNVERMLSLRSVNCWVEGMVVDELIIGARARMTFVCLDRKLGNEIIKLSPDGSQAAGYDSVPVWLRRSSGNYLKQKGKTFFAVQFAAEKPWDFDLTKIRVGEYFVQSEEALLGDKLAHLVDPGESVVSLPSGFEDVLGFYVPIERLKPGEAIQIGYGDDLEMWTVPVK